MTRETLLTWLSRYRLPRWMWAVLSLAVLASLVIGAVLVVLLVFAYVQAVSL